MSQELFIKKKEQHLQHQLLLQQHHQHPFPSPITPSPFDKKVFPSPSSTSSRQETSSNGSSSQFPLDISSNPLFSPSASSTTASSSNQALSSSVQRHSFIQNPFNDVYGSGGGFLNTSYPSTLGASHHDLNRSSCSALPSPTIYPPTPPPSTHWVHPAWLGSLESAGYMKTPKSSNSFEN